MINSNTLKKEIAENFTEDFIVKEIMHTDSTRIKRHMEKFYDTYIQTPDIVKQEDIDFMRKSAKEIIASCKKY